MEEPVVVILLAEGEAVKRAAGPAAANLFLALVLTLLAALEAGEPAADVRRAAVEMKADLAMSTQPVAPAPDRPPYIATVIHPHPAVPTRVERLPATLVLPCRRVPATLQDGREVSVRVARHGREADVLFLDDMALDGVPVPHPLRRAARSGSLRLYMSTTTVPDHVALSPVPGTTTLVVRGHGSSATLRSVGRWAKLDCGPPRTPHGLKLGHALLSTIAQPLVAQTSASEASLAGRQACNVILSLTS